MEECRQQDQELVFALDIGTRSIVGVVGRPEDGRLNILGIESAEHGKRVMMDGQIDNIDEVAALARVVTQRLESKLQVSLSRVSVAAAGRALRTQTGSFALELPAGQPVNAALIGELEAGAVTAAEAALMGDSEESHNLFLVGYTAVQYRLDGYPMSTLLHHNGARAEVDVVATFLPGEVVESLYAAMHTAGLQVSSMTLEPIAAMNAAIPADIRLLNLALVDIGAGTSDIAICRDGGVVGYTMVTVAGDEVTEEIMRTCLVDFQTAEQMKRDLENGGEVRYTNVLGLEETVTNEALNEKLQGVVENLAAAIAGQITDINGGAPSALFLSGGGSKLYGLRERISKCLQMDLKRVAVAGNNYEKSCRSDEYDLNNPEYATPLGIAISAGMGLLNDSYIVMLNGKPAKLFRSGVLTLRNILMMNGYRYSDIIGTGGKSLTVTLDGKKMQFRGEPAVPAILRLNGEEVGINTSVHAGDQIDFVPARCGADASRTLRDLLGEGFSGRVLINNREAALDTPLNHGDTILVLDKYRTGTEAVTQVRLRPLHVELNGETLDLPGKQDGAPYYMMDMLVHSGLDFQKLERPVRVLVNDRECGFQQVIQDGDRVDIFSD